MTNQPASPRRVYGSHETNSVYGEWLRMCTEHNARVLRNGENPTDYPTEPVAFETLNFGWILSKPDGLGNRQVLVQF